MNNPIRYFDEDGNVNYIDSDDAIGIALLAKCKYIRFCSLTPAGEKDARDEITDYFTNQIAFINCLAKWSRMGELQPNSINWTYTPAIDWFQG